MFFTHSVRASRVDDLREEMRVAPFGVHVRHREEAVEVVEADVLRLRGGVLADVPLADGLRDIARLRQELRQRHLALQAAGLAVHRRPVQPMAVRHAAGHQRCARRRAGRLGIAGRELQAAAREPVEVRRRRAHRHAAAVAAEVAPADVVHQENQDVGPLAAARDEIGDLLSGSLRLGGMRERRLQVVSAARTVGDAMGSNAGMSQILCLGVFCARARRGFARRRAIDSLRHGRGRGFHQLAVHRGPQGMRFAAARLGSDRPVHEVRRKARIARSEQRLRAPEQLVQAARERYHFLRQCAARRGLQFARHAAVPAAEAAPQVAHDELGLVVHRPQIGLRLQRGGRADLFDDS